MVDFGAYLKEEGFAKFHFDTLNMRSLIESKESKQWFKDNLQIGVQLINSKNDPEE